MAFHKALSDQPRDPLVVAVFSLAVYNGGDMLEAVKIARRINKSHDESFCELFEPRDLDFEALKHEVMDLAESSKGALSKMTDEYFVSQAMAGYSRAPFSDLVSISFIFPFSYAILRNRVAVDRLTSMPSIGFILVYY